MNGVNGANMAAGGMPGPSPAGHQAELNYIYGMVEELSKQLADNRKATEDIVNGLGRVRARARTQGQNNDEVIVNAAADINGKYVCSYSRACANQPGDGIRPRREPRRPDLPPF